MATLKRCKKVSKCDHCDTTLTPRRVVRVEAPALPQDATFCSDQCAQAEIFDRTLNRLGVR